MSSNLQTITDLSREFGSAEYVVGGGGNSSVKTDTTIWIKPSGTTLNGLKPQSFVAMNRKKMEELYGTPTPSDPAERETLVKNMMAAAVENDAGRPSVEAPLHNIFETVFVLHTHPTLVNGMTCAKHGDKACARLFPEALWVDYIDPGYTLCMEMRTRLDVYRKAHGRHPSILMLKNHGVFVAADTAEEIRAVYKMIMTTLAAEYSKAGINTTLKISETKDKPGTADLLKNVFGNSAEFAASCGAFPVAPGPLTPDHMVYARAFPFTGEITRERAGEYAALHKGAPKIAITDLQVYGLGSTQRNAELALATAQDAALVLQLTSAFGGAEYMTDRARLFIENWEVESYRAKIASGS